MAESVFKAVIEGGVPDINAAITAGADVNARDKDGVTPLMIASGFNRNPEVAKTLIEAGAQEKEVAPLPDGKHPLNMYKDTAMPVGVFVHEKAHEPNMTFEKLEHACKGVVFSYDKESSEGYNTTHIFVGPQDPKMIAGMDRPTVDWTAAEAMDTGRSGYLLYEKDCIAFLEREDDRSKFFGADITVQGQDGTQEVSIWQLTSEQVHIQTTASYVQGLFEQSKYDPDVSLDTFKIIGHDTTHVVVHDCNYTKDGLDHSTAHSSLTSAVDKAVEIMSEGLEQKFEVIASEHNRELGYEKSEPSIGEKGVAKQEMEPDF